MAMCQSCSGSGWVDGIHRGVSGQSPSCGSCKTCGGTGHVPDTVAAERASELRREWASKYPRAWFDPAVPGEDHTTVHVVRCAVEGDKFRAVEDSKPYKAGVCAQCGGPATDLIQGATPNVIVPTCESCAATICAREIEKSRNQPPVVGYVEKVDHKGHPAVIRASTPLIGAKDTTYTYDPDAEYPHRFNSEPMIPDPVIAEAMKIMDAVKSAYDEHRLAVLWVNDQDVLEKVVEDGLNDNRSVYIRATWPTLPKDVRVHYVQHEWGRRQFGFVLSSREFPPALVNGLPLPDVPGSHRAERELVSVGVTPRVTYPNAVGHAEPNPGQGCRWAVYVDGGCGELLGQFPDKDAALEYLRFVRGS